MASPHIPSRKAVKSGAQPSNKVVGTTTTNTALEQALASIRESMVGDKFFPGGITKLMLELNLPGSSGVKLSIEGPEKPKNVEAGNTVLDSPDTLTFSITRRIGLKARGTLSWPSQSLSSPAVSGDSGHAAIDIGTWTGRTYIANPTGNGYCDPAGNCWFFVFMDQLGRTDMGIHPDGGVLDATLGCIGLSAADTTAWRTAFASVGPLTISCKVVEALSVTSERADNIKEKAPPTIVGAPQE